MTVNWIKIGIGGSIFVVTVLVTVLSYKHYSGLVEDNSALTATVSKLETALDVSSLTVLGLTEQLDEWQAAEVAARKALEEQTRIATRARAEVRRLDELFARHDLEKLARHKPELIERRINDGSARMFRMLECASGAPECSSSTP